MMITLGEALRNERQKANISLEEISKKTNIGIKSLAALENGHFKQIPGDFYLRNYIKSYLAVLGINEQAFMETHGNTVNNLKPTPEKENTIYYSKLKYSRFRKKNLVSVSLFVLLVIIITMIFYMSKDNIHRDYYKNAIKPSPVLPGKPVPEPAITNLKPIAPTQTAQLRPTFSLDTWPITAEFEFADTCWLKIYRKDRKILEQVFKKGDKQTVRGYEMYFFIGNPSAVKLLLNNKEVKYLKGLSHSEVLSVTPDAIEGILNR
ncbi:MAG: helix-turn-helix domain-containing protein [Candidatus Omnitrophota bacterium]